MCETNNKSMSLVEETNETSSGVDRREGNFLIQDDLFDKAKESYLRQWRLIGADNVDCYLDLCGRKDKKTYDALHAMGELLGQRPQPVEEKDEVNVPFCVYTSVKGGSVVVKETRDSWEHLTLIMKSGSMCVLNGAMKYDDIQAVQIQKHELCLERKGVLEMVVVPLEHSSIEICGQLDTISTAGYKISFENNQTLSSKGGIDFKAPLENHIEELENMVGLNKETKFNKAIILLTKISV